jgi:hypothetical protein
LVNCLIKNEKPTKLSRLNIERETPREKDLRRHLVKWVIKNEKKSESNKKKIGSLVCLKNSVKPLLLREIYVPRVKG